MNYNFRYKALISSFLCLMLFAALNLSFAQAYDWEELKSDHFIVYFIRDDKFAADILKKSEEYYQDIASELGYQRHSNFWTWENRVKIFIFPDKASFIAASHQPDWSEGMASYTDKEILSYSWSEDFSDALLPHEIAHLIFRDYIGFKGEAPLWLDEGVAQWMEPMKRQAVKLVMADLLKQKKIIPLKKMMELDLSDTKDTELVNTFYVHAISLVGFLIETYKGAAFTEFCRQLRDGKALEEALQFSYPTQLRNLKELEEKWMEYVRKG